MRRNLLIVLLIALIARAALLASGSVSFHSDEAVVALMARHILQGERPIFFYGQAYMGSLDAWLVAVGFSVFGESVLTIRLVQAILYLLIVATGYWVAWRVTGKLVIATVAGLILALPPILFALYTTATLGGYNEMLLCGNLVLLFGYGVARQPRSWWRWAALGGAAGVGWWSNGLIIAFALPVALLILYRIARSARRISTIRVWAVGLVIAAACFVVGSAPWWGFNFENNFAPLRFYLVGGERGEFAGTDIPPLPFGERVIGLIFLGLPAVFGLRFPWSPAYIAPAVGVIVAAIYVAAVALLLRKPNPDPFSRVGVLRPTTPSPLNPLSHVNGERGLDSPFSSLAWEKGGGGLRGKVEYLPLKTPDPSPLPADRVDYRWFVFAMIMLFCGLFVASRFSIDPTGRYFLPLILPLGIAFGALIDALWENRRLIAVVLVALVIGYDAAGQISAAVDDPPGFTTQFNLDTHIPNTWDDELIAFLDEHDLHHGYTNYWISFRLAFLSGDRMQYSAALSYKPDLSYTPADERYPPYRRATDAAERIAYITANVIEVKAWLEARFAERGVTYQSAQVGVYHIYYDFAPVAPRPPLD